MSKFLKVLEDLFIVSVGLITPIKPLLLTVGLLIILDLISGLWASYKRGKEITSSAMSRTLAKIFLYNMCIISGFFLEKFLLDHAMPISKVVAGVIGMVEFKSLLENTNLVLGVDIMQQILDKLSSKNLKVGKKKRKHK